MACRLPQPGGCDFPVDPDLESPEASVFWLPQVAPAAVCYLAEVPGETVPTLNLENVALDAVRIDETVAVLRIKSGPSLVLDAKSLSCAAGILLPLDEHWSTRVVAARRLREHLLGRSPTKDPLTRQQRARILSACRLLDAQAVEASYRTIARHVFGPSRVDQEPWKTSSIKAQIARLAAHATHLTERGYRSLLLGQSPTTGQY